MKSILIIVSLAMFQIKSCQNEMLLENSSFQIFEGYISESVDTDHILLQDKEAGSVIELKFYFDSPEGIDFEEFNYVEVKGFYNSDKNVLLVEELYPLFNQKLHINPTNKNSLASVH